MGCAQVIFLQTKIINETCDVGSTDNVLAKNISSHVDVEQTEKECVRDID